jgi:hypothetical protein
METYRFNWFYVMAKKFYPKISTYIDASPPHPENTQYKISIGEEDWSGSYQKVVKVQMVYDNVISGRRSPSYPINSNDTELVFNKINELIKNEKGM